MTKVLGWFMLFKAMKYAFSGPIFVKWTIINKGPLSKEESSSGVTALLPGQAQSHPGSFCESIKGVFPI
jgi:hypothetical protein